MLDSDIMRRLYEAYDAHQFRQSSLPGGGADGEPRTRQVLQLVGTGQRILDVGVSRGDFALALVKQENLVVGVDISEHAVAICRLRGLEAYRLNIEEDPLGELGMFDGALMLEIVEHLIDPLTALRRVRTILKEGGWLILSTPNAAYVKWRLQLLRGDLPDFGENRRTVPEPRPYNLLHKTPLTINSLRTLLAMSGFRLVHLEPEDYGVSPAWDRPGLREVRHWLRRRWPSLFAGAVVVKCVAGG